jgi:hypothetical protein
MERQVGGGMGGMDEEETNEKGTLLQKTDGTESTNFKTPPPPPSRNVQAVIDAPIPEDLLEETSDYEEALRRVNEAQKVKALKEEAIGIKVVRGPDWEYGFQDGGPSKTGLTVGDKKKKDGWITVRWDADTNRGRFAQHFEYRVGAQGKYDLCVEDQDLQDLLYRPLPRRPSRSFAPVATSRSRNASPEQLATPTFQEPATPPPQVEDSESKVDEDAHLTEWDKLLREAGKKRRNMDFIW